ncbi:TPA: DUF2254 domain-containing protein, partial [Escherichia coli]
KTIAAEQAIRLLASQGQSIRVRMGVCFVPKANVANSALFSDGAVATGTATVQSAKANTLPLRG